MEDGVNITAEWSDLRVDLRLEVGEREGKYVKVHLIDEANNARVHTGDRKSVV